MTGIVKPLRWPDTLTGTRLRSIGDAFGHYYCIAICGKDETGLRPILRWAEKGGPWSDDTYHSWDAAKDAAQADYEARILSTLTTLPTYAAGWEAGRRAAAEVAENAARAMRMIEREYATYGGPDPRGSNAAEHKNEAAGLLEKVAGEILALTAPVGEGITDAMIERGARAMARDHEGMSAPTLDAYHERVETTWRRYEREVRLVLEAALAAPPAPQEGE